MGKSTLVNGISTAMPELRVRREGDYCPIDLAWCTWMSKMVNILWFVTPKLLRIGI